MKLRLCSRCLLIVAISLSITNAEHRVKKDINLIKDLVLSKIFGNQNESKSKPIYVQDNFYSGLVGLPSAGKEEIKIKIPKEGEEPYRPEYTYKQIRNDGSALVYTLNDNDEVIVSDTRNQQNPIESSEYNRNKPAISSFQARLKPSIPCKANPPIRNDFLPFNPPRQIVYSMPQAPKNSEYTYKVIHKDGSVTTYFGTGEVQEQQLRDPTPNVNRFIQNPQPYVMNRVQNLAGAPFLPNKRNLVFREEIEPIEIIDGQNQLPSYALPQNEPAPNIIQNEVVYLQQPSYNVPVRIKPMSNIYDQVNIKHPSQDVGVFEPTMVTQSAENTSEDEEIIPDAANKMEESNLTTLKTSAPPDNESELTVISSPSSGTEKEIFSEVTTLKMSANNDGDDVITSKTNRNFHANRGDIPTLPN